MLDILRFNYYFYQINDVILMKSLGKTLKEKRESIGFTLREVEDTTGVSNAYLSQLENDKIKKPSANILYKLSNLYKLQLNELISLHNKRIKPRSTFEDGYLALKIANAAYKSLIEKRVIKLK